MARAVLLHPGRGRVPAKEELDTYLALDSRLPGHPVRGRAPGVELCTGAWATGCRWAWAWRSLQGCHGAATATIVLMGDGELQEGSVWEAAMAAAQLRLDNLIAIVDRNGLQLGGRTEDIMALEPLADKWTAFGFQVHATAGNDVAAFVATMEALAPGRGTPHVVIATTVKGKGISFIENQTPGTTRCPLPRS